MKRFASLGTCLAFAAFTIAAQAGPADDVKAAAKKLADSGGYSWKSTVDSAGGGGGGGGGRFGGGPTEGKISKEGTACLSMTRGDTKTEAVVQGTKAAVKTQEGWQSLEELRANAGGGGGRGRGGFTRTLQNFRAPAAEAEDLVSKARELAMADGAYSGELTTEGAKSLLSFGRGGAGGGGGPEVSDPKGHVKFWVKDGVLTKYQYHVQGRVSFNGNERDVDRTTTVEIKDVGSTTVQVPEEAKKKLS